MKSERSLYMDMGKICYLKHSWILLNVSKKWILLTIQWIPLTFSNWSRTGPSCLEWQYLFLSKLHISEHFSFYWKNELRTKFKDSLNDVNITENDNNFTPENLNWCSAQIHVCILNTVQLILLDWIVCMCSDNTYHRKEVRH